MLNIKKKKLLETLSTRQLKMSTRCHVNLQSQLSLKNVFLCVELSRDFYQGIVVFLCWTSSGYRTVLFSLPHSLWSEYRVLCLTIRIHQQQYRLRLPLFLFFLNWKKEKKNLGLLGAAVIGFRNVIFFLSWVKLVSVAVVSCKETMESPFRCVVNVYCGLITIL